MSGWGHQHRCPIVWNNQYQFLCVDIGMRYLIYMCIYTCVPINAHYLVNCTCFDEAFLTLELLPKASTHLTPIKPSLDKRVTISIITSVAKYSDNI